VLLRVLRVLSRGARSFLMLNHHRMGLLLLLIGLKSLQVISTLRPSTSSIKTVTVAQAIPSCIHHSMTLLRLLIVPGLLLLQELLLEVLVILSGNGSSTDTLLMAFYMKIRGSIHTNGSTCLRSGCCLALSLSHVLMCAVIRYLWIPCLLLLTISSLNIVGLCLGLLQKCTHMITVLNCRLFLLSRDGSVRRRVIQH